MKTLKLGIFSLLAVLAVSVFLTSCEQDTIDLPDVVEDVNELSFDHDKDLEIFSENGLNKVIITASSNDESLLNEIEQANFNLVPIFEQPAEDLNQSTDDRTSNVSEDAESFTGGTSVGFNVNNVVLEEGAIGYKIEVKGNDYNRASGNRTWYSSRNKVLVKRYGGLCHRAEVWRRLYSSSNYSYKINHNNCSNGSTYYNGGNSYRLKAKISYGSSYNYNIWFWN